MLDSILDLDALMTVMFAAGGTPPDINVDVLRFPGYGKPLPL